MLYGLYIVFTFLLAVSPIVDAPVKTIKSFELPNQMNFEMVDGLMILKVPGDIGNNNFIFDTGAEQLIFNETVHNAAFSVISVDREIAVNDIMIDEMSIGSLVLESVPAWGMNLDFLSRQLDTELRGIIGARLFDDYSVMIDYDNNTFRLVSSDSPSTHLSANYNVVATSYTQEKGDLPVIEVAINDSKLKLGFDTGANISAFDANHTALLKSSSSNNSELNELKLSQAVIKQLPYLIKDMASVNDSRSLDIDGIISAEALATNKIFIDSDRKKIFLFWEK